MAVESKVTFEPQPSVWMYENSTGFTKLYFECNKDSPIGRIDQDSARQSPADHCFTEYRVVSQGTPKEPEELSDELIEEAIKEANADYLILCNDHLKGKPAENRDWPLLFARALAKAIQRKLTWAHI